MERSEAAVLLCRNFAIWQLYRLIDNWSKSTGMEELIRHFSRTDDFDTACGYLLEKVLPEYVDSLNESFSLEALRRQQNLSGHIGQKEYAAMTEKGLGWFEVNAFMGVDEEGNPIANILGRDITEAHEQQEKKEREAYRCGMNGHISKPINVKELMKEPASFPG